MLAAVALARPEADPYFYHHGVVGHVHPECEHGVDTLEVQSCAPRVAQDCTTADVVSEEITYEKIVRKLLLGIHKYIKMEKPLTILPFLFTKRIM